LTQSTLADLEQAGPCLFQQAAMHNTCFKVQDWQPAMRHRDKAAFGHSSKAKIGNSG